MIKTLELYKYVPSNLCKKWGVRSTSCWKIWNISGYTELFTARKQSLGQGNIFIGVCQEFCSQGGAYSGGCLLWGACSWGCLLLGGLFPGDTCSQAMTALGGLPLGRCLVWGVPGQEVPGEEPPQQLLLQVVCILLECILVGL